MTPDNKIKILVVDDDEETRQMYVELFWANGFAVVEAIDGVEGLDKAQSETGIDCIFSGIEMPRMTGFEMIEMLKKDPATADIPILINSHYGREEDRNRATELGVKDFIIRGSVTPAEVIKRIKQQQGEGLEYQVKIDPYGLDAERLIEEQGLPAELACINCGTALSVKLTSQRGRDFLAKVVCPNCGKEY